MAPAMLSVRLDLKGHLAEIVLNKPEKRNALSVDMWAAIPNLVQTAVSAPGVKVLIVHGGDAKAFAAGADISEFGTVYADEENTRATSRVTEDALTALETCPKPVLAAIEGACVGGEDSLAMACDLRIASENSKFGVTPAKLGLVYPPSHTRRLIAAVGPGAAKDIRFTGRIFPAAEARDLHLIDRLVASGTALEETRTLARQIAANSQWSVRAAKQMIAGLQSGWADDDPSALALSREGFSNADFQDGYKAFLEKRPPNFTL